MANGPLYNGSLAVFIQWHIYGYVTGMDMLLLMMFLKCSINKLSMDKLWTVSGGVLYLPFFCSIFFFYCIQLIDALKCYKSCKCATLLLLAMIWKLLLLMTPLQLSLSSCGFEATIVFQKEPPYNYHYCCPVMFFCIKAFEYGFKFPYQ